jgi:hypothetical protein
MSWQYVSQLWLLLQVVASKCAAGLLAGCAQQLNCEQQPL